MEYSYQCSFCATKYFVVLCVNRAYGDIFLGISQSNWSKPQTQIQHEATFLEAILMVFYALEHLLHLQPMHQVLKTNFLGLNRIFLLFKEIIGFLDFEKWSLPLEHVRRLRRLWNTCFGNKKTKPCTYPSLKNIDMTRYQLYHHSPCFQNSKWQGFSFSCRRCVGGIRRTSK